MATGAAAARAGADDRAARPFTRWTTRCSVCAPFLGQIPEWRELTSFLPGELARRNCSAARRWPRPLPRPWSWPAPGGSSCARTARSARSICAAGPPQARSGCRGGASVNERAQELRLVEALLFAAAEPLADEMLAARLGEAADLRGLLRRARRALCRARRQPGAAGRRLDLSHRARPRPALRERAAGGAQAVARRGRDAGGHRLSPAGHPRRDRGDPRRRARRAARSTG